MRKKLLGFIVLFLGIGLSVAYSQISEETRSEVYYFQKGREALEADAPDEAVQYFSKADSLRSNHPVIMRYLVRACARAEEVPCALSYLRKVGLIDADIELLEDPVLDPVRNNPEFAEIRSFYEEMNRYISKSDTAFTISERDLHPEGLGYDPVTGSFFIGSIRKRKVVRTTDGQISDLISKGLLSVSGVAVDSENRKLWVTSPAAPQMERYAEEMQGTSHLVEIDLEDGRIIRQYTLEDTLTHYFGDLVIDTNGDVYVSDSNYPAIYKLSNGANQLELFKHLDGRHSLQGLTFSKDGASMYISDYVEGIFKIGLKDGSVVHLQSVEGLSLKGIDGLYFYRQSLIAVQNGVQPMRITRIFLAGDGNSITGFEYLEKNNPALDEPTLGTVVDDTFYFVANSPWGKYNRDGSMQPADELPEGLILKISLND